MENIRLYPFWATGWVLDGLVFRQGVRAHKDGRGCVEDSRQEQGRVNGEVSTWTEFFKH